MLKHLKINISIFFTSLFYNFLSNFIINCFQKMKVFSKGLNIHLYIKQKEMKKEIL